MRIWLLLAACIILAPHPARAGRPVLDANGDGFVQPDEARQFLAVFKHPALGRDPFAAADIDGNGQIPMEEWERFMLFHDDIHSPCHRLRAPGGGE